MPLYKNYTLIARNFADEPKIYRDNASDNAFWRTVGTSAGAALGAGGYLVADRLKNSINIKHSKIREEEWKKLKTWLVDGKGNPSQEIKNIAQQIRTPKDCRKFYQEYNAFLSKTGDSQKLTNLIRQGRESLYKQLAIGFVEELKGETRTATSETLQKIIKNAPLNEQEFVQEIARQIQIGELPAPVLENVVRKARNSDEIRDFYGKLVEEVKKRNTSSNGQYNKAEEFLRQISQKDSSMRHYLSAEEKTALAELDDAKKAIAPLEDAVRQQRIELNKAEEQVKQIQQQIANASQPDPNLQAKLQAAEATVNDITDNALRPANERLAAAQQNLADKQTAYDDIVRNVEGNTGGFRREEGRITKWWEEGKVKRAGKKLAKLNPEAEKLQKQLQALEAIEKATDDATKKQLLDRYIEDYKPKVKGEVSVEGLKNQAKEQLTKVQEKINKKNQIIQNRAAAKAAAAAKPSATPNQKAVAKLIQHQESNFFVRGAKNAGKEVKNTVVGGGGKLLTPKGLAATAVAGAAAFAGTKAYQWYISSISSNMERIVKDPKHFCYDMSHTFDNPMFSTKSKAQKYLETKMQVENITRWYTSTLKNWYKNVTANNLATMPAGLKDIKGVEEIEPELKYAALCVMIHENNDIIAKLKLYYQTPVTLEVMEDGEQKSVEQESYDLVTVYLTPDDPTRNLTNKIEKYVDDGNLQDSNISWQLQNEIGDHKYGAYQMRNGCLNPCYIKPLFNIASEAQGNTSSDLPEYTQSYHTKGNPQRIRNPIYSVGFNKNEEEAGIYSMPFGRKVDVA